MIKSVAKSASSSLGFWIELRARLIFAMSVLIIIFAVMLYFSNQLYAFIAAPLLKFLPQGHLIATQVVSPFFVPFRLAFFTAFLCALPVFLYQFWAFIQPALYSKERRLLWPFLFISTLLFYCGLMFAYWVIFPMLFHFLTHTVPYGVQMTPDIGEYLDFTTKLLLVFGLLFEIPMVMVLLVSLEQVSRQQLKAKRSYAIVGAFILGMLLGPPDVISQTILALPIWLLYESGILLSGFLIPNH